MAPQVSRAILMASKPRSTMPTSRDYTVGAGLTHPTCQTSSKSAEASHFPKESPPGSLKQRNPVQPIWSPLSQPQHVLMYNGEVAFLVDSKCEGLWCSDLVGHLLAMRCSLGPPSSHLTFPTSNPCHYLPLACNAETDTEICVL